jgi:hypothetical protein
MPYVESDRPNRKTFYGLESLREELSRKQAILPVTSPGAEQLDLPLPPAPPRQPRRTVAAPGSV